MASSSAPQSSLSSASFIVTLLSLQAFVMLLPSVHPLSFNFSSFTNDGTAASQISLNGDAMIDTSDNPGIRLTDKGDQHDATYSAGRAVHKDPLLLWDTASGNLTDFITHFSFVIESVASSDKPADGIAFFLAPYPATEIPGDTKGENLGVFSASAASRVVAVEFDTYHCTACDPPYNGTSYEEGSPRLQHVGIDVMSKRSIAFTLLDDWDMAKGHTAHATVSYNASTMNLSVILYYDPQVTKRSWSTSSSLDLRKYLPEEVSVGFSASTGRYVERNTIVSWDFSSTLENKTILSVPIPRKTKNLTRLFLDVFLGVPIFLCGLGLSCLALYLIRRIRMQRRRIKGDDFDNEFEAGNGSGMGPKSFQYKELATATGNFAHEKKLGQGGSGSVYHGVIGHVNQEVAIKRISRESMQRRKEYLSEVTVISRLRHRNLVQLIGYCHERGELLLVYQFMPNRSLDWHLYSRETLLRWQERYKIAVGLASALFYLHEEWEQCVVHRDLKPSNVMLDVDFNPKLGDFGLARLVDHDNGAMMTVRAGTIGYMAPEYEETGKASKESDIYAFGVVVLEIACGRRPIDYTQVPGKISLVGWVRDLYEKGNYLAAVDRRLRIDEFDERLMERLMVVGLWCAQPDYKLRPSIRHVVGVLCFDGPLPELPQLTETFAHHDYIYSSAPTSGSGYYSALASSSTSGTRYDSALPSFMTGV